MLSAEQRHLLNSNPELQLQLHWQLSNSKAFWQVKMTNGGTVHLIQPEWARLIPSLKFWILFFSCLKRCKYWRDMNPLSTDFFFRATNDFKVPLTTNTSMFSFLITAELIHCEFRGACIFGLLTVSHKEITCICLLSFISSNAYCVEEKDVSWLAFSQAGAGRASQPA